MIRTAKADSPCTQHVALYLQSTGSASWFLVSPALAQSSRAALAPAHRSLRSAPTSSASPSRKVARCRWSRRIRAKCTLMTVSSFSGMAPLGFTRQMKFRYGTSWVHIYTSQSSAPCALHIAPKPDSCPASVHGPTRYIALAWSCLATAPRVLTDMHVLHAWPGNSGAGCLYTLACTPWPWPD